MKQTAKTTQATTNALYVTYWYVSHGEGEVKTVQFQISIKFLLFEK